MKWPVNCFDNTKRSVPAKKAWLNADQLGRFFRRTRVVDHKEQASLVSFCEYRGGAQDRKLHSIVRNFAVVGDIDSQFDQARFDAGMAAIRDAGIFAIAHETYSSRPESPRWRVIVFLDRGIEPPRYADCWRGLHALFGGMLDHGAKDAARISYLPSCPPGESRQIFVINGAGDAGR